jgi:hypothetical protein
MNAAVHEWGLLLIGIFPFKRETTENLDLNVDIGLFITAVITSTSPPKLAIHV